MAGYDGGDPCDRLHSRFYRCEQKSRTRSSAIYTCQPGTGDSGATGTAGKNKNDNACRRTMKAQGSIWVFVAAAVILPVTIYAGVHWYEQKFDALPVLGEKDHAAGSFNFTDQDGKPFTEKAWENK